MPETESLTFDAVIVGAGPAGLTTAIHLAQKNPDLNLAVVEKGAQVGAHILSGALFNPEVLTELIPNWSSLGAPVTQTVTDDRLYYMSKHQHTRLPTIKAQKNKHCFIISLGELCQWLAQYAEGLGISIFPGFAIQEPCFNAGKTAVIGVRTRAMGLDSQSQPTDSFQPSIDLLAPHVFIAEGARGSTAECIIKHFSLREGKSPQHYGIGIKEKWRITPEQHRKGEAWHTVGWPLPADTYGGGFIYHKNSNELVIGLIIGLHCKDAAMDPYLLLQQYKAHPKIAPLLKDGECIGYGARAINEGGFQSIPQCHFPGGSLIGCSAGFVNVAQSKGIHHAMRTGILAADAFLEGKTQELTTRILASKTGRSLWRARNLYPAFKWGRLPGLLYAGIDQILFRGYAPWTLQSCKPDHTQLQKAESTPRKPLKAPSSLPLLDLVSLTNTHHRDNQPCHLALRDPSTPMKSNWPDYGGPEQHYCPAGVYEYVELNGTKQLQINAQNCIHCKTCDIRDPNQNILWSVPEGGDGPNYSGM